MNTRIKYKNFFQGFFFFFLNLVWKLPQLTPFLTNHEGLSFNRGGVYLKT